MKIKIFFKALVFKIIAKLMKYEFWRKRMTKIIEKAFFSPPDLSKAKKVLCIQPHPDDNEIGMGGIIGKMVKDGIVVDYLTITDGGLGTTSEKLKGDKLVELRRNEALASAKVLGVSNCHFFNYPDGELNDVVKLSQEICELIRTEKYDFIFAPDPFMPYEAHQDHLHVGHAASSAAISANLLEFPKGTATSPHTVIGVGFYFTNKPNTIIDTTNFFNLKFKAIKVHKSQINSELLEMYRVYFTMNNTKLGEPLGYKMAEGIKLVAPMHLHCIVETENI